MSVLIICLILLILLLTYSKQKYEDPLTGKYKALLNVGIFSYPFSQNNKQIINALNSDIDYVISPIDLKNPDWLNYAINYVPKVKQKLKELIYKMSIDSEYKSSVMCIPAIYDNYDQSHIYPNMYLWIVDTLVMSIAHLTLNKNKEINELNKTFLDMLKKLD